MQKQPVLCTAVVPHRKSFMCEIIQVDLHKSSRILFKRIPFHIFNKIPSMKTFNEILASLLLFSCVAALIYMMTCVLPSRQPNVTLHEHKYILETDSAGNLTDEARCQADSLIAAVKHHERSINEHYDYVLQQKEDTQNLYTVIGTILSVVLAVFGFFGYKNYKSIEEKAVATVNDKVDEKMREVVQGQENAITELHKECRAQIGTDMTKQFVEFKDKTLDDVISRRLKDEYIAKVEPQLGEVDGLKQRLSDLENNLQLLAACYFEIDNKYRQTEKSKRYAAPKVEKANDESNDVVAMVNNHGKGNNKEE